MLSPGQFSLRQAYSCHPLQTSTQRTPGGQQDSNARRLLYALRPYLKEERQEKIERALQLARLFQIGRKFLSEWEG